MKPVLVIISVAALAIFASGCENYGPTANQQARSIQAKATYVVESIQYIKDLRTGLCFAHREGLSGGMALATVPCDAVPLQLLVVGELKNEKAL